MNKEKRTVSPDELRAMSRRGFLLWGAAGALGAGGYWALWKTPEADGIQAPLRKVLGADRKVAATVFSDRHLSVSYPTLPKGTELRENGDEGIGDEIDVDAWKLDLKGPGGHHELGLDTLKAIGSVAMTTELRCVEGWTRVASWVGVRLSDVLARYPVDGGLPYAALTTPDNGYYVGLDRASALHPQTLLAWELNGEPLASEHGGPLRLVIPTKYGVKWLKRVGTLTFTDHQPADYWAERGYDFYLGL